jgi:hypothetical protein
MERQQTGPPWTHQKGFVSYCTYNGLGLMDVSQPLARFATTTPISVQQHELIVVFHMLPDLVSGQVPSPPSPRTHG